MCTYFPLSYCPESIPMRAFDVIALSLVSISSLTSLEPIFLKLGISLFFFFFNILGIEIQVEIMFAERYRTRNVSLSIQLMFCTRIFQVDFNENISLQIMGKWYVVEILEHRVDPTKPVSSSYIVDSCPIVRLKSQLEHAALKLLWSEESGNVEYTFRIPDISRRKGLWRTMATQNGKVWFTFAYLNYNQLFQIFTLSIIRYLFAAVNLLPMTIKCEENTSFY
jgi:hypothetical protein